MSIANYYDLLYPMGGAIRFFTPTVIFGFLICIPFLQSPRILLVIKLVMIGWIAFVLCYTKFVLFPAISFATLGMQAVGVTILLFIHSVTARALTNHLRKEAQAL